MAYNQRPVSTFLITAIWSHTLLSARYGYVIQRLCSFRKLHLFFRYMSYDDSLLLPIIFPNLLLYTHLSYLFLFDRSLLYQETNSQAIPICHRITMHYKHHLFSTFFTCMRAFNYFFYNLNHSPMKIWSLS
jgi:hypothetical protein